MTKTIVIADDYSITPGPRSESEGPFSGERFRDEILYPAVQKAIQDGTKIRVVLDGAAGYGTSFLEEAFGGLIRVHALNEVDVINALIIISEEEDYLKDDIQSYILNR